MKIEDVRQKTDDQLSEELLKLRKEQLNLRFQQASGQLEGVGRIRTLRKSIARIKTIMTERARTASAAQK